MEQSFFRLDKKENPRCEITTCRLKKADPLSLKQADHKVARRDVDCWLESEEKL